MKKFSVLICLAFATCTISIAQNVGIGTVVPTQKLHITDGVTPNLATLRVTGLGSASTIPAGTGPFSTVMVDANGILVRGGTAGAGSNGAWFIQGNSGTNPLLHFIGTTDAQDLILKTGGIGATNERMRVIGIGATPGQIVLNNTSIYAGDVFSVYANGTGNATTNAINNNLGAFAVNGYASGNASGVYGETDGGTSTTGAGILGQIYGTATTASGNSEGVYGVNSTAPSGTGLTAANAMGVRGEATGAAGGANTMGVLGNNTGITGFAYGVYGISNSPSGQGLFGINNDVSANPSHGIQGQSAAIGGGAGVRGYNTATAIATGQNAYGVRGSSTASPTGTGFIIGVRGDESGATGTTYGVYGQSLSATGYGIGATNTNASGTGLVAIGNNAAQASLVAGSGAAVAGSGIGTFSFARTLLSGVGLVAVGNNQTTAIITPTSGCGVSGVGTQYGVMGFATSTISTNPANTSTNNGAAGSSGGYFEVQSAGVAQTWAYVGVRDNGAVLRKIIGPGTVNTIVNDLQGNRVALSCPEAPENLFQDAGQGQLVNGHVHINIDPIFAHNIVVNAQHPLRVLIQAEGNCQGVYVSNKSQSGFDVDELNGGQSNIAFTYFIMANRADETNPDGTVARYSAERFPAAPGPQQTQTHQLLDENTAVRNSVIETPSGGLHNLSNTGFEEKLGRAKKH